ncbi:ATP-binding protein [Streptomyces sp. NBC_01481]|uniref:ATP-binding protein n=1 Tax=Streptomyces sp. NBC_01481 TaxID=2975869 RepID=UPI00224EAA18|nr:ATP-binding protein [Streptomyces sp. NBC_01481]MCX4582476.1 ATP-binding protein [Streptomyces sp. NBC_01481]
MAIPTPSVPKGHMLRALATPLDSDPREVSRARRTARGALTSWGLGDLADDMALIVSELVTNAVQHGEGPIVMVLQQRDDTVLIEVADASPRLPVPRQESAGEESGRGLALVQACSDDWGCRARGRNDGKWVWCRRSLRSAATTPVDQPSLLEAAS